MSNASSPARRRELANAIRALSMDAVQQANSGHPGAPMGMADIAEVLWNGVLKHNPANPHWADRDRFVLSNGHGSMLLYSLLYLTGYDLSIDDLKDFRQLHSKTPGHPEFGYAPGVETTTGPLGQGITNAVGFALAEKVLAESFNRDGHEIVDHYTYAFMGDGCLMEGISHEACSLAGTLKINKLVAFWDDNGISIDGEVEGWFTDNTPARFEAYGWNVIADVDGHDAEALAAAIAQAKAETDKPTLICCKTVIGFGSPNKGGKEDCHGAPWVPMRLPWRVSSWVGHMVHLRFRQTLLRNGTHSKAGLPLKPSGTNDSKRMRVLTRSWRLSLSAAWRVICLQISASRRTLTLLNVRLQALSWLVVSRRRTH